MDEPYIAPAFLPQIPQRRPSISQPRINNAEPLPSYSQEKIRNHEIVYHKFIQQWQVTNRTANTSSIYIQKNYPSAPRLNSNDPRIKKTLSVTTDRNSAQTVHIEEQLNQQSKLPNVSGYGVPENEQSSLNTSKLSTLLEPKSEYAPVYMNLVPEAVPQSITKATFNDPKNLKNSIGLGYFKDPKLMQTQSSSDSSQKPSPLTQSSKLSSTNLPHRNFAILHKYEISVTNTTPQSMNTEVKDYFQKSTKLSIGSQIITTHSDQFLKSFSDKHYSRDPRINKKFFTAKQQKACELSKLEPFHGMSQNNSSEFQKSSLDVDKSISNKNTSTEMVNDEFNLKLEAVHKTQESKNTSMNSEQNKPKSAKTNLQYSEDAKRSTKASGFVKKDFQKIDKRCKKLCIRIKRCQPLKFSDFKAIDRNHIIEAIRRPMKDSCSVIFAKPSVGKRIAERRKTMDGRCNAKSGSDNFKLPLGDSKKRSNSIDQHYKAKIFNTEDLNLEKKKIAQMNRQYKSLNCTLSGYNELSDYVSKTVGNKRRCSISARAAISEIFNSCDKEPRLKLDALQSKKTSKLEIKELKIKLKRCDSKRSNHSVRGIRDFAKTNFYKIKSSHPQMKPLMKIADIINSQKQESAKPITDKLSQDNVFHHSSIKEPMKQTERKSYCGGLKLQDFVLPGNQQLKDCVTGHHKSSLEHSSHNTSNKCSSDHSSMKELSSKKIKETLNQKAVKHGESLPSKLSQTSKVQRKSSTTLKANTSNNASSKTSTILKCEFASSSSEHLTSGNSRNSPFAKHSSNKIVTTAKLSKKLELPLKESWTSLEQKALKRIHYQEENSLSELTEKQKARQVTSSILKENTLDYSSGRALKISEYKHSSLQVPEPGCAPLSKYLSKDMETPSKPSEKPKSSLKQHKKALPSALTQKLKAQRSSFTSEENTVNYSPDRASKAVKYECASRSNVDASSEVPEPECSSSSKYFTAGIGILAKQSEKSELALKKSKKTLNKKAFTVKASSLKFSEKLKAQRRSSSSSTLKDNTLNYSLNRSSKSIEDECASKSGEHSSSDALEPECSSAAKKSAKLQTSLKMRKKSLEQRAFTNCHHQREASPLSQFCSTQPRKTQQILTSTSKENSLYNSPKRASKNIEYEYPSDSSEQSSSEISEPRYSPFSSKQHFRNLLPSTPKRRKTISHDSSSDSRNMAFKPRLCTQNECSSSKDVSYIRRPSEPPSMIRISQILKRRQTIDVNFLKKSNNMLDDSLKNAEKETPSMRRYSICERSGLDISKANEQEFKIKSSQHYQNTNSSIEFKPKMLPVKALRFRNNNNAKMTERNTRECALCDAKPRNLIYHYIRYHKCESYVSRFAFYELKNLSLNTPLAKPILKISTPAITTYKVICPFCSDSMTVSSLTHLYHHLSLHTGEYAFECSYCELTKPYRADIQSHQSHSKLCSKSKVRIRYQYSKQFSDVYLYYCTLCNFVQLHKANVLKHLRNHHDPSGANVNNARKFLLVAVKSANAVASRTAAH